MHTRLGKMSNVPAGPWFAWALSVTLPVCLALSERRV